MLSGLLPGRCSSTMTAQTWPGSDDRGRRCHRGEDPDTAGLGATFFPHRTVGWPGSDPLVTALGGTRLHRTATGKRFEPDTE